MTIIAMALAASFSGPVRAQGFEATPLLNNFMQAWNRSDAKALAALFASDADLITPDGIRSRGREGIESFYAAVFARGYAGSIGTGEIVNERALSSDISLIDARWSISHARNADGSERPAEKGILVAVAAKDNSGWRILALRENRGASDFTAFPPQREVRAAPASGAQGR